MQLFCAPLQGFTDYRFRNLFQKYFGGTDAFFAPYIRLKKDEIKPATLRDIQPVNNANISLIPQVMTAKTDELLHVIEVVKQLHYTKLNWNLGCPYPMVAKRGMGSGLLPYPNKIRDILTTVFHETNIELSVKLRLGYTSSDEIFPVLNILNKFPITHITIHPRIAKQMYKGEVNLSMFGECLKRTQHTLVYNGDIRSFHDYRSIKDKFPKVENWMIGRGLISNPFLPWQIKEQTPDFPVDKIKLFADFHADLLTQYSEALSGDKHVTQRMYQYWEYFIELFPNSGKLLKKLRHAQSCTKYKEIVQQILTTSYRKMDSLN